MKLIMENWRQYLNESIDPRIQKQIDMLLALPDVAIKLQLRGGAAGSAEGFRVSYVRTGKGAAQPLTHGDSNYKDGEKVKTGYPHGSVDIFRDKNEVGECLDSWFVYNADAEQGWGPLLYEIALEWASQNGGGLGSDRAIVSPYAQAVWNKYAARSDVGIKQMDVSHDLHGTTIGGEDVEDFPQLTPDAPEDDCDQSIAIDIDGKRWHKSSLSKMYFKGTPEVMTVLKKAGRLVEG